MWIYAKTSNTRYVKVRALLTTNTHDVQGWSFGVKHDSLQLQYGGGDMTVQLVTTNATHTATVKGGGQPDFNDTQKRGNYAFTQAVVVDFYGAAKLASKINFVAAGACYLLFVPSQSGSYQVQLQVSSQVGSPAVDLLAIRDGTSIPVCARNFTFNIYVQPTYSPVYSSCSSSGPWIISGDAAPGPGWYYLGLGNNGPLLPPFLCGDYNGDKRENLTDAVFLLNFLFLGGPEPCQSEIGGFSPIKQTGQAKCWGVTGFFPMGADSSVDCASGFEAVDFDGDGIDDEIHNVPGQDGFYQKGTPRAYTDTQDGTVTDIATALIWQKKPVNSPAGWFGALQFADDDFTGDQSDWRLPNITEALTVCNYGKAQQPAVDDVFDLVNFPDPSPGPNFPDHPIRLWTSTPFVHRCNQFWRTNVGEGHLANNPVDDARASWFVRGGTLVPLPPAGQGFQAALQAQIDTLATLEARPQRARPFNPRDISGDNFVNLTDAVFLLNFLFLGGPAPCFAPTPVLKTGAVKCFRPNPSDAKKVLLVNCTQPVNISHAMQDGLLGRLSGVRRSFQKIGDTVKDNATGLIWANNPLQFGSRTWEDALLLAEGLNFAGKEDWRLPNVNELATLLNHGRELTGEELCCADGQDNDLDGLTDAADPDCQSPEMFSIDGEDNDRDGMTDAADPDCPENCTDFLDNDGDTLVDCRDPDCQTTFRLKLPLDQAGFLVFDGIFEDQLDCTCFGAGHMTFWTSTTSTLSDPTPLNPSGGLDGGRTEAFVVNFLEGKIHNDELCNDKNGVGQRTGTRGVTHHLWPVRGPE